MATRKEYHLIDTLRGCSLGGFETLEGARLEARRAGLASWQIFNGNLRVENHDPSRADPVSPHMIVVALELLSRGRKAGGSDGRANA